MNDVEKKIAELFVKASTQNPVATFEETSTKFSRSISSVGGASASFTMSNIIFSIKGVLFMFLILITACFLIFQSGYEAKNDFFPSGQKKNSLVFDQNSDSILFNLNVKKNIEDERELNSVELNTAPSFAENNLKTENVNEIEQSNARQKVAAAVCSNLMNGTFSDSLMPGVKLAEKRDTSNFLLEAEQKDFIKFELSGYCPEKDSIILFTINELSTESDFSKIAKQAREAGIKFKYQVHHQRIKKGKKRKKIKTEDVYQVRGFKINMMIDGTDKSSQISVKVSKWGKFEVNFGWHVNEEGKAVALIEDSDVTKASSSYPKQKK